MWEVYSFFVVLVKGFGFGRLVRIGDGRRNIW
jgi:hypothetical protein